MKRVLLSSVVAVMVMISVFAGLSAAKERKKVRVATEGAYPPWNATDPAWTGDIFGLGNGIDVRKEDPELKAIFNKALESLQKTWFSGPSHR